MAARKTITAVNEPEKVTASASVPEGGSLARTIGDVLEALEAQGADLHAGVYVTLDGGVITAEGSK